MSKYIFPFLDEAVRCGVRHIAFLSVVGADRNKLIPHSKIENYILNLGIDYTFVRPCFFMQNLTTIHRKEILENNKVYIPAGNTPVNYIDVRDVARLFFPQTINLILIRDGQALIDQWPKILLKKK